MINGIIFDADGTLLDSMGFWTSTIYDIALMGGLEEIPDGLIDILNPMSMYEGAVYLRDHYGVKKPIDEMIAEENKRVLEFYTTRVTLLPRMEELTRTLYEAGVPLAVATATDRPLIEQALCCTGLIERFGAIVSCTDVGFGKDSPQVFLRACELIGTRPENTLVVDDSPMAIETAKRACFPTVFVCEGESTYDKVMELLS